MRDPIDPGTLDRFTDLAARVLDVPVVYLSLVDDTCDTVVSSIGVGEPAASRVSLALMNLMVASGRPVLVTDGWAAPPEANWGAASYWESISTIVAIPLVTSDGLPVGTLTLAAPRPCWLSTSQREFLKELCVRIVGEVDIGPVERRM